MYFLSSFRTTITAPLNTLSGTREKVERYIRYLERDIMYYFEKLVLNRNKIVGDILVILNFLLMD